MWYERDNSEALFCDRRKESITLCNGYNCEINPDVISDFTQLPFPDESFHLVAFDPPHLKSLGTDTSWLAQKYGRLIGDWKDMISEGFRECFRVLKTNGTLVFKWSEHEIPLAEVVKLSPIAPLFGNNGIGGTRPKTHWVCFIK